MIQGRNFIRGRWKETTKTYRRENPAHPEETVGIYPLSGEGEAQEAFSAAEEAFPKWKRFPLPERARLLRDAAQKLQSRKEEVARAIAKEVGKPLTEARGEVQRAIDILEYYAAYAYLPFGHRMTSNRPETELQAERVPLGVVALITPWNFPIAIPTWKLAPALILGNTVVLKPASLGPAGAIHLVQALEEAGLPEGVVNLVIGPGTPFGKILQRAQGVRAVSFTGSAEVGVRLKASLAGLLVRVQLELGGKNAYVVWKDADLTLAARQAAQGAFFYAGQKCTATSRILVHQNVYGPFKEALLEEVQRLRIGDPLAEETQVGPLIDRSAQENVARWVEKGRQDGGRLLFGGQPLSLAEGGYFFSPTVLEGLDLKAPLAQEEVFGPVVTLHPVASLQEAIQGVNATPYGLSASIATRDLGVAARFLEAAEVGLVHVNQPTAGVEYQAPFGGTKGSGYGPKEQGWAALEFYGDWKTRVVTLPEVGDGD
jgi:acyl-CoA reductase-like NAD-dependent aldehyde dehydrogenase